MTKIQLNLSIFQQVQNSTKTDYPSYATLTRPSKDHSRPHSLQSYSNQENPSQSQLQNNAHSQKDFSGEKQVDLNENENTSSQNSAIISKPSEFLQNSETGSKLFPPSKEQISEPDEVENSVPFCLKSFPGMMKVTKCFRKNIFFERFRFAGFSFCFCGHDLFYALLVRNSLLQVPFVVRNLHVLTFPYFVQNCLFSTLFFLANTTIYSVFINFPCFETIL